MKRVLWALAAALSLAAPSALFAATFTVINTNDSGIGSLRWAIDQVNLTAGPHRIAFNIPGPGVQTIHLLTAPNSIANTVAIDGSTQPGYEPNQGQPKIEVDGTGSNNSLLIQSSAPNSSVKAMTWNRFPDAALNFRADACTLSACWFGINNTGSAALATGYGAYVFGKNCLIGGHSTQARNVFSGMGIGIMINSPASGDTVCGNFFGTDATGKVGIPNSVFCLTVSDAPNVVIGGKGPFDGNVISASSQAGLYCSSSTPVPNGQGISIYGNYIGTDATGQNAIPNKQDGILLWTAYATIGDIGAGNVISGNQGSGIHVVGPTGSGSSHDNIISSNKIGVSADGTKKLGNSIYGVFLDDSNNNFIGGNTADGTGNLIGGNGNEGIVIDGVDATNNIIEGNAIGTTFNGALDLGNNQQGIAVNGDYTIIGETVENAGNIIAFNQNGGINVFSLQNNIRGNAIFNNRFGLGIDLSSGGGNPVTPNDSLDVDSGPNYLQNFPVITAVSRVGTQVRLQGRYSSEPSSNFILDFFSNRQCNSWGNGEGESWLGSTNVTTNTAGLALFDVSFVLTNIVGYVFTCTATDFLGDTSEFSPCAPLATQTAAGPGPPGFAFEAPLPSPARRSTSFTFTLAEPSRVSLCAFDVSGQAVADVLEGDFEAGPHTVAWNVEGVRAGVYFCRLVAGGKGVREIATRSVIVIR